jgi:hypothetical protein
MATLSKIQKDYQYVPRSIPRSKDEEEWEKQSLERQRVERVHAQNPVAPPPKQPQKPVYSNPVSKIQKDYSYGFGSPVSIYDQQKKPKTYSFQPEIPGENVIVKPQPNFKPQDSGFYWNPMPKTGLRDVTLDDKLKEQDLYRFKPVVDSIKFTPPDQAPVEKPISKWETNVNNYMQSLGIDNVNSKPLLDAAIAADMNKYMRQFITRNPTATKMQQQEFEKLLQKELLERYYNKVNDITIPSTPPASPTTPYVNPVSSLPRTTYQAITQNELLKDLPKLPVSPPYNTGKTPAKETPESGAPDSGVGKYLPWTPKGYTFQELRDAGYEPTGTYKFYDDNARYWDSKNAKSDGEAMFSGFYMWNGKYYPINQLKAQYALYKGIDRLSEADFNNPYKTESYYYGYTQDMEDFIKRYGAKNIRYYNPSWRSEGINYQINGRPNAQVDWNAGGGGGVSGNLGNDPRGRGWYYNPAVNWTT